MLNHETVVWKWLSNDNKNLQISLKNKIIKHGVKAGLYYQVLIYRYSMHDKIYDIGLVFYGRIRPTCMRMLL